MTRYISFFRKRKRHADIDGGSCGGVTGGVLIAGFRGAGLAECQQIQRKGTERLCRLRAAGVAEGNSRVDSNGDFQWLPDNSPQHYHG